MRGFFGRGHSASKVLGTGASAPSLGRLATLAAIAIAAACMAAVGAARSETSSGQSTPLGMFGISVSPGTPPTGAISAAAAERVALAHSFGAATNGQLDAGVTVSTQYGLVTDADYGPVDSNGKVAPAIENAPAWIVSLSGTGVGAPVLGPHPTMTTSSGGVTTETVLVNAQTGAFMETLN